MNTLKKWSAWSLLVLVATIATITVLNVQYAHGWGERTDVADKIAIIACRGEPRTDWEEWERPIPGVKYMQAVPNKDGVYECQRDIYPLVPRNPEVDPGNMAGDVGCARAGMTIAPQWQEQHPGWAVVTIGCPNPMYNEDGRIIGYQMPGCPREMTCKFDEQEI